jgi:hypothetical protein
MLPCWCGPCRPNGYVDLLALLAAYGVEPMRYVCHAFQDHEVFEFDEETNEGVLTLYRECAFDDFLPGTDANGDGMCDA